MDHNADMHDSDLAGEMLFTGTAGEGEPNGPGAEALTDTVENECEIAALSQAAGIDSTSLTDIQIMEALYQMR